MCGAITGLWDEFFVQQQCEVQQEAQPGRQFLVLQGYCSESSLTSCVCVPFFCKSFLPALKVHTLGSSSFHGTVCLTSNER